METGATSELAALKTKLRATWIAGDFGQIAKYYTGEAEEVCKSAQSRARNEISRCRVRHRQSCAARGACGRSCYRRGHCAEPGGAGARKRPARGFEYSV